MQNPLEPAPRSPQSAPLADQPAQVEAPPPTRFEVELEALANPQYVNFLAQNNYLEDEQFIKYLEYLEYWRKPEYVKFLIYPNCLHVLTLLKQPLFRQEVRHADIAQMVMDDMYAKWLGIGNYRILHSEEYSAGEEDSAEKAAEPRPTSNGHVQANDGVTEQDGPKS